ncbi:hypothetical protein NEUTE2DRAFT_131840 [Neurospora tetrasperma FGSC 2509]|nr:hypothetical protein NEUTE2DRAFT_131840 [Neurospora tetrasperma FGSC 2509]
MDLPHGVTVAGSPTTKRAVNPSHGSQRGYASALIKPLGIVETTRQRIHQTNLQYLASRQLGSWWWVKKSGPFRFARSVAREDEVDWAAKGSSPDRNGDRSEASTAVDEKKKAWELWLVSSWWYHRLKPKGTRESGCINHPRVLGCLSVCLSAICASDLGEGQCLQLAELDLTKRFAPWGYRQVWLLTRAQRKAAWKAGGQNPEGPCFLCPSVLGRGIMAIANAFSMDDEKQRQNKQHNAAPSSPVSRSILPHQHLASMTTEGRENRIGSTAVLPQLTGRKYLAVRQKKARQDLNGMAG